MKCARSPPHRPWARMSAQTGGAWMLIEVALEWIPDSPCRLYSALLWDTHSGTNCVHGDSGWGSMTGGGRLTAGCLLQAHQG